MRVVIVGAGIIGAACALYASRAGLEVTVLERHAVASGSTGAGEGNLLVSDKAPGPELAMALRSLGLWHDLDRELGGGFELELKGGLVVARSSEALVELARLGAQQREQGVDCESVDERQLRELEPHLGAGFAGGALYPADAQVQPMLAAARLLRAAVSLGARLQLGTEVFGLRRAMGYEGEITGVVTDAGVVAADYVVNAAGSWSGELAGLLGAPIPVEPRRGIVLVTEPLPRLVRHKVYGADYVANVSSSEARLQTSPVVEGTAAGPVLIGASRERVGFDRTLSVPILRRLAAQAVELFPVLAGVNLIRAYPGFRPYCPDHLPVVGLDRRIPGLLHACGHEGAGIGLAPATGELVAELIGGGPTTLDASAFDPVRVIGRAA